MSTSTTSTEELTGPENGIEKKNFDLLFEYHLDNAISKEQLKELADKETLEGYKVLFFVPQFSQGFMDNFNKLTVLTCSDGVDAVFLTSANPFLSECAFNVENYKSTWIVLGDNNSK
jgi:hypothetical protein